MKEIPTYLIQTPNDRIAVDKGYYVDLKYGDNVIWVIENFCTHHRKPWGGQPFILEEWQKKTIHQLYSWRKPNGKRRFNHSFLLMGRGNGKTKLCSSLAQYHLLADGQGSEIYCGAFSREQAHILFDEVARNIRANPELKHPNITKILQSEILYHPTGSKFKAMSAEGASSHGYSPSAVFIDELHTFKRRDLIEAFETGLNKRGEDSETLIVYLTTAGYPNTVYDDEYQYAKMVQSGEVEDLHYLPILFEVPNKADWTDESLWHLAQPNLGITVSLNELKLECQRAKLDLTTQLEFRRLKLNQQIQAENKWLSLSDWDSLCISPDNYPDTSNKKVCQTFIGLDLSESCDMTALIYLHRTADKFYVEPYFYLPSGILEKTTHRLYQKYREWYEKGELILHEGNSVSHEKVLKDILDKSQKYHIYGTSLDPWQGVLIMEQLKHHGFKDVKKFVQNKEWYTTPCKEFEKAMSNKMIHHTGSEILRWMVDNVVLDMDANGSCMPSKTKSNDKTDGVCALIMALDRAVRTPPLRKRSIYESSEILVL